MIRHGVRLLITLTLTLVSTAMAQAASDTPTDYSSRVFNPNSLDTETVMATTLENLINEKVQRLARSNGVENDQFGSDVTVQIKKTLIPPPAAEPAEKKPEARTPAAVQKPAPADATPSPNLPGFGTEDLFDARKLMSSFQDERKREEQENAPSPPNQPTDKKDDNQKNKEPAKIPDQYNYEVERVYIHAALDASVSADIQKQVQSTLKNAFEPKFGNRLKLDFVTTPTVSKWLDKTLNWVKNLQLLGAVLLASIAALLFLILFKVVPSWQAKQALKTDHKEKNESTEAPSEDAGKSPQAPEPVQQSIENLPPTPVPHLDDLAQQEMELCKKIFKEKKAIVAFASAHPEAVRRVVSEWGAENEDPSKISLGIHILTESGFDLGKIEFRREMLQKLKEFKKKPEEPATQQKAFLLGEIYWDLVANQHLSHEVTQKPLAFIDSADDALLMESLIAESPAVQAAFINVMSETRAGAFLSRLTEEVKRKITKTMFNGEGTEEEEILAAAARVKTKLEALNTARDTFGEKPGVETMVGIISTMDFPAQFGAAQDFLKAGADSLSKITRYYFNVALLPVCKDSFLAKIFVDKDTRWIQSVLSAFSSDNLNARVTQVLPPMQQRMLSDIPTKMQAESMNDLRALNASILDKIAKRELALDDIYNEQVQTHDSQRAA